MLDLPTGSSTLGMDHMVSISQYITGLLTIPLECLDCAIGYSPINNLRPNLSQHHITTFYLRLYGIRHMVKDHSDSEKGNLGYSFRLTARVLLYAPSHRQDSTYHGLRYTSHGALAITRNSSMGSPHEGSIRRPLAT